MLAYVNPNNNLAHCFACRQNLNNIDLLRVLGYDFRSAVALLEQWLEQYRAQLPRNKTTN
ncbi:MAG TPA: hypothetical protein VGJ05_21990 [Fimbriiglobus sp.]|jgi:hypothetical protein